MFNPPTLDALLGLCGDGPYSAQKYREAETALEEADTHRQEDGWVILPPWQAYAVKQLLAQAQFPDPCVEEFTKAVPGELRPPGMTVRTG
jgi:hypothetical protein